MIWLTWRQFRTQTIVTAAALAVLAVILAITGVRLAHLYDTSGVAACVAHRDCSAATATFVNSFRGSINEVLAFVGIALTYGVPAVIGVFWGAPLVTREIEAGTLPLAWSQSVTRTRWLAVKLGLIGLTAMATAGLLSLMVTWWSAPIFQVGLHAGPDSSISVNRLDPLLFGAHGIAPIGYATFAFALGVTAGVLIRRTLPAMAATLAVFAAIQLAMPLWIRPHLIPPLHATAPINVANLDMLEVGQGGQMTMLGAASRPGDWILSNQTITPSGHVFTGPATQACLSGSQQTCNAWVASQHLQQLISYQPASRYWAFQGYETGIFLVLALALAGWCFWRIRRRRLF